jgi:Tol biopolymer transport system component
VRPDGSNPKDYDDQVWSGMLSGDGRFAVFSASCNGLLNSPCPDGENNEAPDCTWQRYSPSGEYILLPMCRSRDVYLRDLITQKTQRISQPLKGGVANGDSGWPAVSRDGSVVAFVTEAFNLANGSGVLLFYRDPPRFEPLGIDSLTRVSEGPTSTLSVSDDGSRIALDTSVPGLVSGDANSRTNVIVRDLANGWLRMVSVSSNGVEGNGDSLVPHLSGNGKRVAFESSATNLVPNDDNGFTDIFVHDIETGRTWCVSVASDGTQSNHYSSDPRLSADGEWVTFKSTATNLASGIFTKTDNIFVHNNTSGVTERVTVGWDGSEPSDGSQNPSLSADGRYVAFDSHASNLVPWDENGVGDVFVRDRKTNRTLRVSEELSATETRSGGDSPSISDDGRFVLFLSGSRNLVERTGSPKPLEPREYNSLFIADLQHAWDDE